jgi:hypothetical protein
MNEQWHKQNRMPKNPTIEQRIKWHLEHQKACDCREIPKKLQEEIVKRKNKPKKKNADSK